MRVFNRYEYLSPSGKRFTKWFVVKKFDSLGECITWIKNQPKKINGLKNEYQIADVL